MMLLLLVHLWFFLTVTLPPSSVSSIPTGVHRQGILCKETERNALVSFKAGLVDKGGLLSSWSEDENPNCCNWKGVSCSNQTGHVLKLDLRYPSNDQNYLQGQVSSSLIKLKFLQYLDLSINNFYPSTVPTFLGSLENLRYLDLSSTYFSGIIPPHLGNLSSLQYLNLGSNFGLKTESLQWLMGLSSLKYLNLNSVSLTKVRPDWLNSVNMLPSLLELHLSDCGLSDFSPPLIHHFINFTSLSTLDLSDNDFGSSPTMLPSWLFNLSGLVNLQLSNCFLQGKGIPSEIGKLSMLQNIDLAHNFDIGGHLPASLGNLSNLVMLNFKGNGIRGRIPATFGRLCKLKTLHLVGNNLEGEITQFFNGLARCTNNHLEFLILGNLDNSFRSQLNIRSANSFWGSVPSTIGSLKSLKFLDLSNNKMNGTISESIGQLSDLEILDLSGNLWQGILTETHFEKHAKMRSLQISTASKTSIVMDVRQDWIPPFTSLIGVRLDGTEMRSKKFPRWIQNLREVETVSLVDCGIWDSIPIEVWTSCTKLRGLYLSNNAISVGDSLQNLEGLLPLVPANKLEALYLDNNSLGGEGEIPSKLGQLAPALSTLDLSSSSISGKIPPSICKLKNLWVLVLRNNFLTGELTHHRWAEMTNLQVLDVSNNSLVGRIPESLGSLDGMYMLFLNDNHLKDGLPIFRNCTRMQMIDVGGNNLTGKIPASFSENKRDLAILRLRGNMLSGSIPPELCLLSAIKTLDLAHNSFQGTIPPCLGNLSSLDVAYNMNLSSVSDDIALVSKGREYIYHGLNLRLVHLVDLSDNNLSGKIPESLMNLTALQTLNLSMNHLTGEIPSNIGMLRMLESLDISQNQLSGQIPQSLSALSSLSFLNLSHNNLSGRIPSSTQLQTLGESSRYDGNPLLCGLPLPTKCPGDGDTTKEHHIEGKVEHSKKRFDLEEWGFVLSIFLGFVVGFWGVCGSLVLKASWRKAYFGYLEGIKDKIVVTVAVSFARLQRKMGEIRVRR